MTAGAAELLHEMAERGIRLTPAGQYIDVEPSGLLTDIDRQRIRANKPELIALLEGPPCPVCGEPAPVELDGRAYCERHTPTTPLLRALVNACDIYNGLGYRWDALVDSGEPVPQALKDEYFAAGHQLDPMLDAAKREADQ